VLLSGESARVRPGDEVVLVDGLELLASGREFAFATVEDEAGPGGAGRLDPLAEETVEVPSTLTRPWRPTREADAVADGDSEDAEPRGPKSD
jgi:hypothetical protein